MYQYECRPTLRLGHQQQTHCALWKEVAQLSLAAVDYVGRCQLELNKSSLRIDQVTTCHDNDIWKRRSTRRCSVIAPPSCWGRLQRYVGLGQKQSDLFHDGISAWCLGGRGDRLASAGMLSSSLIIRQALFCHSSMHWRFADGLATPVDRHSCWNSAVSKAVALVCCFSQTFTFGTVGQQT